MGTIGTTRPNHWQALLDEVSDQLDGVVQHLPPASGGTLERFVAAVLTMSRAAADATRLLADRIEGRIRRQLRLGHDPSAGAVHRLPGLRHHRPGHTYLAAP